MMNERMKKPYQKPQLIQVKLLLEQGILTNCKVIAGQAGPGTTCNSTACKNPGAAT